MQTIARYNTERKSKRAWALLLLVCFLSYPAALFALPSDWSVETGSAKVESPDSNTLNFTVADQTVINFGSFNIGVTEAVNFIQPSAASTVLSRVTGPSMSNIEGTLTANGILFLVNPNGIHFAPTANVQVNALVASSLDIATQNFLNNSFIFQHGSEHPYAQVLNEGRITGNNIALLGSSVHNDGIISAVAGTVNLASGDKITLSFDARQLIHVEINEETSGMVVDAEGNTIQDAVANNGTLEASQVFLTAGVARNLFENAVNQTGVVKAISLNEQDGVIRILSDKKVRLAGLLDATGGFVDIASMDFIEVAGDFQTRGTTNIEANGDIQVDADFANVSGDLFLIADSDLDGVGAFKQAAGTFVSTVESGDITIQSSGEGTLANIDSAEDLILKQGGAAAVFSQQPDSTIVTKGSMVIEAGVTVQGGNAQFEVGENWVNQGEFIPQESTVSLVSPLPAFVLGSNTFNNFVIIEPGKIVKFDAEATQTILGTLTVRGAYGNLVSLGSIDAPKQWKLNPRGSVDVMFAYLGDVINIRGPPITALHSDSSNVTNWVVNVLWTGNGSSSNWSDANNWDTGTVPVSTSQVLFNGLTGLNSNNDSTLDAAFQGTLGSLTLDGYTGTLCLEHSLTLTGDMVLKSGTLKAGSQTITVAGNWVNQGGTFLAETSTVVFNDATRPSYIYGGNTFYHFTSETPSKVIYFEAGKTQTITGTFKIQGAYAAHVKLLSATDGETWYIDPQGPRELDYVWVDSSHNLGEEIYMTNSTNRDNSFAWDPTISWVGGTDLLWSTDANWGGGVEPGAGDDVIIDVEALELGGEIHIDVSTTVLSLTIGGTSSQKFCYVILDDNLTLNVTNNLQISNANANKKTKQLAVGNSTVNIGGDLIVTGGTALEKAAHMDLATGTLNVTGNLDIVGIGGLLDVIGGGTINVGGDWRTAVSVGTFNPGTGTVNLNGTGTQTVYAGPVDPRTETFYNLTATTTTARTITFQAGNTFAITNNLILQGASGQLLTINSTASGTAFNINPTNNPGANAAYLSVQDSNNTSATVINPYYSTAALASIS